MNDVQLLLILNPDERINHNKGQTTPVYSLLIHTGNILGLSIFYVKSQSHSCVNSIHHVTEHFDKKMNGCLQPCSGSQQTYVNSDHSYQLSRLLNIINRLYYIFVIYSLIIIISVHKWDFQHVEKRLYHDFEEIMLIFVQIKRDLNKCIKTHTKGNK